MSLKNLRSLITKYMARKDQLDNRLMKIEEQCQPTPSLDHAASRLVKNKDTG